MPRFDHPSHVHCDHGSMGAIQRIENGVRVSCSPPDLDIRTAQDESAAWVRHRLGEPSTYPMVRLAGATASDPVVEFEFEPVFGLRDAEWEWDTLDCGCGHHHAYRRVLDGVVARLSTA